MSFAMTPAWHDQDTPYASQEEAQVALRDLGELAYKTFRHCMILHQEVVAVVDGEWLDVGLVRPEDVDGYIGWIIYQE